MVRVKSRYLLVSILYPTPAPPAAAGGPPVPALVAFRRPAPAHLTVPLLLRALRAHVAALFGDYGAGVTQSSLAIKYFSPATSTLIVRCARAHYRLVWAALTLLTHLPPPPPPTFRPGGGPGGRRGGGPGAGEGAEVGEACVLRVVRVSGTIRKAAEEAVRRARADIVRAKRAARAGALEQGREVEALLEDVPGGMEGEGGLSGAEEGEDLGVLVDEDEEVEDDEDEDDDEDEGEDEDEAMQG